MSIEIRLSSKAEEQYEQMSVDLQNYIKNSVTELAQRSHISCKYKSDETDVVRSVAHLEIKTVDSTTWYEIVTNYEDSILSIEHICETTASKVIDSRLHSLDAIRKLHIVKARKMLEADNGNLYPFDLFITAVYNRSMSLIDGFSSMIVDNFNCAAPLLRLQLDNAIRVNAASLVNVDIHEFAMDVMGGKAIKYMTDKDNPKQKLTDRYLVDKFSLIEPRIRELYKQTSGYVHLSEKHMFNSIKIIREQDDAKIHTSISGKDNFISDSIRVEAATAMIVVTEKLLWLLDSWTRVKNNPVVAAESYAGGETRIHTKW